MRRSTYLKIVAAALIGGGIIIWQYVVVQLTKGPTPMGEEVVVFADNDFQGARATLGPGTYDLSVSGKFPNDIISSLAIGRGVQARVCMHISNGLGLAPCFELKAGTVLNQMPPGWNDQISFIEVKSIFKTP